MNKQTKISELEKNVYNNFDFTTYSNSNRNSPICVYLLAIWR